MIGVDVQRIRRTLGLKGERAGTEQPDPDAVPRERLQQFEQHVRRELERELIERTQALPPAKPLREFDRALPRAPRRTSARCTAWSRSSSAGWPRRAASSAAGGARGGWTCAARCAPRCRPAACRWTCKYRPKRPRRPELYVLCDVSTSVTSASVFFLSVLHALHDQFRKLRSFVFVERISEVTEVFERERSFEAVSRAIATDAGVADVSGYTDYGRVWLEFLDKVVDDLDPRSTVIVLGDARTNGREPHAGVFAQRRRARRAHLLDQPRAEAVLELRRLGDVRLRAVLRRRLRVLDDEAARGVRERDGRSTCGTLGAATRSAGSD